MTDFKQFGLLDTLLATLKEKKLRTPTPIQLQAIPPLLEGKSVVGVAQTGSGKTLAYALPILHVLKTLETSGKGVTQEHHPRAVVVVPSRELGEQVSKVFKTYTHDTRLRVRTVLGGTTTEVAKKNLVGCFEILIATPGRLKQLLARNLVNFNEVRTLVFDEADQMLDEGFLPDARNIAAFCPEKRQMALFSATVNAELQVLIGELFEKAHIIRADNHGEEGARYKLPDSLVTQNREVIDGKREPLLEGLLGLKSKGSTIIFANTRQQCDKIAKLFEEFGVSCVMYRGEMEKVERRKNLQAFREGKISYLISTDLASRGLDIESVDRIINYHLPMELENYIHRVGRTARAGRKGTVINFVTERDVELLRRVAKLK